MLVETDASLDPLFIFSPAARCGITLLQRLYNSSGQIIIYGENAFLTAQMPNHLIKLPEIEAGGAAARQRLAEGDCNFWSSSLWPAIEPVQKAVISGILAQLKAYQASSRADGYARWGIKNPLVEPRCCAIFFELLPGARFIFLHRHVVDVMRSYKSRRWLQNPEQLAKAVGQWLRNMEYMRGAAGGGRLLLIGYEELTGSPDEWSARLEAFAGVSGIDRSVFATKVNTFAGREADGHAPDEYIAPGELSEQELAAIAGAADAMLAAWGYESTAERAARLANRPARAAS